MSLITKNLKGVKDMNFVAIIGRVEYYKKINDYITELLIKIVKPNHSSDVEIITVLVSNKKFKQELESIKNGTIIGIRGRLSLVNEQNRIISEKIFILEK